MLIRKFHKYISLSLLAVWLLQAATGVCNVFYRELDAALLGGVAVPLDEPLFAQRIDELREDRKPGRVSSVYASGGDPTQFDVFLHTIDDGLHVMRVDGQGNVLREQPWAVNFARSGFLLSMRLIHETLFLGDNALLFIGISGLFLLTNIVLGLRQAWPSKGQWRMTLFAKAPARADMRLLAWHRAVGLWIAAPLLILVVAGVGTAWTDAIETVVVDPVHRAETVLAERTYDVDNQASLKDALGTARTYYPDARLSIVTMPAEGHPFFEIRLLQQHELRRVFGKTIVFVSADTAEILANFDAKDRPLSNRFVDAFYAVHTGEAGGLIGRVIVFLSGVTLIVMAGLGLSLWANRWMRKRARRPGNN